MALLTFRELRRAMFVRVLPGNAEFQAAQVHQRMLVF